MRKLKTKQKKSDKNENEEILDLIVKLESPEDHIPSDSVAKLINELPVYNNMAA